MKRVDCDFHQIGIGGVVVAPDKEVQKRVWVIPIFVKKSNYPDVSVNPINRLGCSIPEVLCQTLWYVKVDTTKPLCSRARGECDER